MISITYRKKEPEIRSKLFKISQDLGRRVGYRVAKRMRAADLRSKIRRKYLLTTDSKHHFAVSPNLL